ncbi:uncharacterized protein LOC130902294 [Diorhabda carinulata]|uniref:uncharacterized protein LOC130902294 n=1 Tax=Diorhabda carinulata TaxID=1163345 RepID=UPI0025A16FCD|nr:uncharacterized protein LOC130902294 [Diorhabda carinulata]
MQRNVENNIQDIKILLEDIIQEILLSLDEKQPPREKSFQVLPNKTDTATILDKTDCGNSEKINLIDRDSIFRKKSKFEVKQPIKRKGASKTGVSKGKHFPKTPLCYLEICRKNQDDPSLPCKCMKCLPEQNRYYCSCYDLICKDIDEEIIGITTFKNTRTQENITNDLKETQNGTDICKICDAQKCSCAFQSRPKIGRSPPV